MAWKIGKIIAPQIEQTMTTTTLIMTTLTIAIAIAIKIEKLQQKYFS